MSKIFKGKRCVYCGVRQATMADHVLARQFVPVEKRADLPKVPECAQCNNEKSLLEHYLTVMLPFGAQHVDAQSNLATMVPPKLE